MSPLIPADVCERAMQWESQPPKEQEQELAKAVAASRFLISARTRSRVFPERVISGRIRSRVFAE